MISPETQLTNRLGEWFTELPNSYQMYENKEKAYALGSYGGLKRLNNQDQVAVIEINTSSIQTSLFIYAVLDGMGGMTDGSDCARLALSAFISSLVYSNERDISEKVKSAASAANKTVYSRYKGNGGTTISALIFDSTGNGVGLNVGDSRIYEITQNGRLKQISIDDTVGSIIAKSNKNSSLHYSDAYDRISEQLVQFVGIGNDYAPNVFSISSGFGYIIASDGAYKFVNGLFERIIVSAKSALEVVKRILSLSEWVGGFDNASLICIWPDKRLFTRRIIPNVSTIKVYRPTRETIELQGAIIPRGQDAINASQSEDDKVSSLQGSFFTGKDAKKKNNKIQKNKTVKTPKRKLYKKNSLPKEDLLPLEIRILTDDD